MDARTPEFDPDVNARNLGMACHLMALCGGVVPFGHIVGPLVFWVWKREECPFVEDQGREVINFQISMTLWAICAVPLCLVLIGIPILIALAVGGLVLTIIGAIRAQNGETYRYPLTVRWLK